MTESQATAAETAPPDIEWSTPPTGDGDHKTRCPDLPSAARCDGENPMTGRACINGDHKGHHRDASGAQWLDD
ncbi:hypothetical protein EV649_7268 [Kribbella sp. VKM Ac-2569]|nr:hypothetical protein EV649_7268 [Kribbella sp. VKM Ac-2569]